MCVLHIHLDRGTLGERVRKFERKSHMKTKKLVGVAVSVVLAVSMVAATAFAAETAPASPTSADKDAGKITFEVTGSSSEGEGMNIELKITTVSAEEEEALKAAGSVQAYLGADAYSEITRILGSNVTISEIKELEVTGYVAGMGDVAAYLHFAALPKAGTQVVVTVKVVTANGNVVTLPVVGTVVEQTSTVNGKPVTRRVVKVVLDGVTMANIQAGKATASVATAK